MTDYELLQLDLSQQIADKLDLLQTEAALQNQLIADKLDLLQVDVSAISQTVTSSVYDESVQFDGQVLVDQNQEIIDHLTHLSGQADLGHQTIYSIGVYVMSATVSIILCAAILMFLLGYKVTRGK